MVRWLLLSTLVLAAGCGPVMVRPARVPAVARPAVKRAPVRGAHSEPLLAVADERRVSIYRPDARSLTKLASWTLAAEVDTLIWVDAKRVAALFGGGRVSLFSVGAKAPQALVVPAAEAWKVPRPEDGDDLAGNTFPSGKTKLLVDSERGLWLGHCAWHSPSEGDPCRAWRYQRLLPSAKTSRHAPAARATTQPGLSSAGLNLKVEVHNYGKSPNTLSCTWGRATQTERFPNKPCESEIVVRWAAPHSRWLLVRVTKDCGKATLEEDLFLVHDCKLEAMRALSKLVRGPGYLWAVDADRRVSGREGGPSRGDGWVVRRRDQRLGWLRGHVLRFSPSLRLSTARWTYRRFRAFRPSLRRRAIAPVAQRALRYTVLARRLGRPSASASARIALRSFSLYRRRSFPDALPFMLVLRETSTHPQDVRGFGPRLAWSMLGKRT